MRHILLSCKTIATLLEYRISLVIPGPALSAVVTSNKKKQNIVDIALCITTPKQC